MDFTKLEKNISHKFNNKKLLLQALTHISYANEYKTNSYENLEFLGDSLLGFVVAEYLCDFFKFDEGVLSKTRAKLVSTEYLCNVAKIINIENYVLVGSSLKKNGLSKKILADIMESLIAAIYMDSDMNETKKFIYDYIIVNHGNVERLYDTCFDYKTLLQEKVQESGENDISYDVVKTSGKDNDIIFTIALKMNGEVIITDVGRTKREAEQKCAKKVYDNMK